VRIFMRIATVVTIMTLLLLSSSFSTAMRDFGPASRTGWAASARASEASIADAAAFSLLAQPAGSTPCLKAELVFLVDQSGSMGGLAAGSASAQMNDPRGIRFFGPLFAMRWLGNRYLASRNIPNQQPVAFSMAVVNFGSKAEVGLDWTTLTPTGSTGWQATKDELERKLAPGRLATSNLGATNHLSAFEKAVELFSQRGPIQTGCPRRTVILLTDGEPNVDVPGFTVEGHLTSIQDLVRQKMPPPDYQIFITGINDPTAPGSWSGVEQKWKEISGDMPGQANPHTQLVSQPDEISARFSNLFYELSTTEAVPPPPPPDFIMPPYQQEVNFVLFKRGDPNNEHLEVSDDIGPITPDRKDMEVEIEGANEPIETIRIRRPVPGYWHYRITGTSNDLRINYFGIPAGAELKAPVGNSAQQYARTQIVFQLVGGDSKPLPEYTDPRYTIQLTATVQSGVRSVPVTMRRTSQQTFTADFVPTEAGEHRLAVLGITKDIANNQVDVVNGEVGSFIVSPVQLKRIGDIGGNTNACGALQQGEPVNLAYAMQRADGTNVVASIPVRWHVTAQAAGQQWDVPMLGPDANGVYSGTFASSVSGPHEMVIEASVLQPATGQEQQALSERATFDTVPTQLLAFDLVQPTAGTTTFLGRKLGLQWLPPFFTAESPPLAVDAKLVAAGNGNTTSPASGTEMDATTVTTNPASLLGVTVKEVLTGKEVGQVNGLRWTGEGGEYSASVTGLAPGRYQLSIQPASGPTLRCGFAWTAAGPASRLREFEVVEDPLLNYVWIPYAILLLVVAVLLVGFLIGRIYAPQGSLLILQTNGEPLLGGSYPLGSRLFNRKHVIKDKAIPAVAGVSRIEAWTKRDWFRAGSRGKGGQQQGRPKRVMVKIYPTGGNPWNETELQQQTGQVELPRRHKLTYRDK
jgi:hypothetical protein